MSGYSLKNLKEVEDSASAPAVEARFARKHLDSREESGPDGLELIAVGSSRPEEGDGVRVEGFWTD